MFLRVEQAIKQGHLTEATGLISELGDYPLYSHLLYQKIVKDLGDSQAVEDFLSRYGQTRQALLLRQRWLEYLARRGDWAKYVENYRETENPSLQCHYYWALANLGRGNEAWAGAEKLWPTGATLPEQCDRLFALWQSSPGFNNGQIWKRFALAFQTGNMPLAEALQRLLPADLLAQANVWRQVHAEPRLALSCSALNPQDPSSGQIFAYGIDRLAANEPLLAQTAWLLHKNRFIIEAEEIARMDRRTALALAAQRLAQAGAYLWEIPDANADAQIRGWRVRSALSRQDWPGTLKAIERLQPGEKKQAQWLYWKARALENLGDRLGSKENYRLAAKERDFFGFNAADRIGFDYALSTDPTPVAEPELKRLADTPPFPAIHELLALNRIAEARSEWFHAIKSLTHDELPIAAHLALGWGQDNLAINTMAKDGHNDDLTLRFPLWELTLVLGSTQSQRADPAMIYALIRRESAFDPNAGSPAGARGLMQLMPSTGEWVALRMNETLPSANALLEPERNLRYGIAYFKELLEKFGNHPALASAAYNAGPKRVERWLPTDRNVPADLWVETIPFSETRQYVAAVLAYSVIYHIRLSQPVKRVTTLLPEVLPGTQSAALPDRSLSVQICE